MYRYIVCVCSRSSGRRERVALLGIGLDRLLGNKLTICQYLGWIIIILTSARIARFPGCCLGLGLIVNLYNL